MTLEDRLEALEKEVKKGRFTNRCLWGAVLLLLTLGLAGTAFTQSAKMVRTNGFVLEDANGKIRAMMKVSPSGVGLSFSDENGKIRLILDAGKNGPGLYLIDENDKLRAGLSIKDNEQMLKFFDENGDLTRSLE